MDFARVNADPVLRAAAALLGVSRVVVTPGRVELGEVVMSTVGRYGRGIRRLARLAPNRPVFAPLYGKKFWERDEVLRLYRHDEDAEASRALRASLDVRSDFRRGLDRAFFGSGDDDRADILAFMGGRR